MVPMVQKSSLPYGRCSEAGGRQWCVRWQSEKVAERKSQESERRQAERLHMAESQ